MSAFEIKRLAKGEKISTPGFYDISLDVHHSQCCDGPSVTSGILRRMELSTPADVFAFHALNPYRWEKPQTTALRLGRAMADFVQGGMEAVAEHFIVLPADKPRKPTDAQIAAYDAGKATDAGRLSVEFWRKVEADPRDPLTEAEQTMIENMGKVLAKDPAACAVMGGIPEVTMAWRDDRTGLWILSRPDTVSFDGALSDYKKVSTQGNPFNHRLVDRRIEQHGYHQQMALAVEGFEMLMNDTPTSVGLVFQSDAAPHHVILREISEEGVGIGKFQNRRAIDRFHECLTSGHWPGPGDDVGAWMPSDWFWKKITEEMQIAGVSP